MNVGIESREISRGTSRRPNGIDYALPLRAIANDTIWQVRDSAETSVESNWKRAHDELVTLAKKRAGLDWQEGRALLTALRSHTYRELG